MVCGHQCDSRLNIVGNVGSCFDWLLYHESTEFAHKGNNLSVFACGCRGDRPNCVAAYSFPGWVVVSMALWCGAFRVLPAAHADHVIFSSAFGFRKVNSGNSFLLAIFVRVVGFA